MKRNDIMIQQKKFWRGVVTGMVVGATVSAVIPNIDSRKVQKNTHKAFSTIGGVVDGVMNSIK